MREDINTFAQRKEHALSNMAIVVLLSHGEDGLVFGTGKGFESSRKQLTSMLCVKKL